MTEAELQSWKGHVRCDHCRTKISLAGSYRFSDLVVCGRCLSFLHEVKARKPKHPLAEELEAKMEMDVTHKAKPKKKK